MYFPGILDWMGIVVVAWLLGNLIMFLTTKKDVLK